MAADLYVCHDLKSQRPEVSHGLPPVYKLVPLAFYLSIVGCSVAMGWFEYERRQTVSETASLQTQAATYQAEVAMLNRERAQIEGLAARATGVAKWVEGALNLQPVCVAVSRAAGGNASINELSLTRNSDLPDQVHLALKMSSADSAVMDATLQGIRKLDFRAYSAQQSTDADQLDYKATLVWQNTGHLEAN